MSQEIQIIPPTPHSKLQNAIYNIFKNPYLREAYICCGTKFGKTLSASVASSSIFIEKPRSKWRWVAPIYSQAEIAMNDYFPWLLPPEPHRKKNAAKLTYELPSIGSSMEFWHAQNPSSLEGAGIDGYVFDEAAKMKAEVRSSARTTLTRTKGPSLYISYPQGKNWFYTQCMEAKEEMLWAIKNGKPLERVFLTAPTRANSFIDAKTIEDAKKELPLRLFLQFYEAEFIDDATVFSGYQNCLFGENIYLDSTDRRWFLKTDNPVVIGADWAKTVDYTVFIAIDIVTRQIVGFQRFHKTKYTEAIRKLILFSRKFKDVMVVFHDKTGLGSVIDDQMSYTELPYEGVVFTNQTKSTMVTQLITGIEQKQIFIPRIKSIADELESYEVQTSKVGNLIYSAVEGKHDDIVSAFMLAYAALIQYGDNDIDYDRILNVNSTKDATDQNCKDDMSPTERYYAEILNDVEDD